MRRGRQTIDTVIIPTDPDAAPKESWWIGLERRELQQRAAQEQRRMLRSRFGAMHSLTTPGVDR